jgi:hypothetical protein
MLMGVGVVTPAPVLTQMGATAFAELSCRVPRSTLRLDGFELVHFPVVHNTWRCMQALTRTRQCKVRAMCGGTRGRGARYRGRSRVLTHRLHMSGAGVARQNWHTGQQASDPCRVFVSASARSTPPPRGFPARHPGPGLVTPMPSQPAGLPRDRGAGRSGPEGQILYDAGH